MNPKTTVGDYEIVDGGNMGESWVDVYAADRLWTPRKINGVYFDGTKDIVIPASGFGIGYLNTTLALQAIPEEYTTSDYAPFEADSILATLDAYKLSTIENSSGITFDQIEDETTVTTFSGSVSAGLIPVGVAYQNFRIFIYHYSPTPYIMGTISLNENLTWSGTLTGHTGPKQARLVDTRTNTEIAETPLNTNLPMSFIVPEEDTQYPWLHNHVKAYDIAWLVCGLVSAGEEELATTYVRALCRTVNNGYFYEYINPFKGYAEEECIRSRVQGMCIYALSFFGQKYPNSSYKNTILSIVSDAISSLHTLYYTDSNTQGPVFIKGRGIYNSNHTSFTNTTDLTSYTSDNVICYFALKAAGIAANNSVYTSEADTLSASILNMWNATDKCFSLSVTNSVLDATKDCLAQALGALLLKNLGETEKLAQCLAVLDEYYTVCNDGQIYTEPAAGYKLTPEDDEISFEATFTTALARMGNGQLNRGMSDIVSARNMFEELKGSLLVNKEDITKELPAWHTLLSVGIPLALRKPNGLFDLDYDIHDAGHDDAVHIHDASEILGLGNVIGSGSGGTSNVTALDDLTDVVITGPVDGQVLGYNTNGQWENFNIPFNIAAYVPGNVYLNQLLCMYVASETITIPADSTIFIGKVGTPTTGTQVTTNISVNGSDIACITFPYNSVTGTVTLLIGNDIVLNPGDVIKWYVSGPDNSIKDISLSIKSFRGLTKVEPNSNTVFTFVLDQASLATYFSTKEKPLDIMTYFPGAPGSNQVMCNIILANSTILKKDFIGSTAIAGTSGYYGDTVFTIKANGSDIGTCTIDKYNKSTFASDADVTLAAGSVLSIVAPQTPDACIGDIAISLKGITQG